MTVALAIVLILILALTACSQKFLDKLRVSDVIERRLREDV